jgi:hypothetical protein
MVDRLIATMLDAGSTQPGGQQVVSDLILFVTSEILQIVLCSSHDMTSPEYFADFIEALANKHCALLSTLRLHTPFACDRKICTPAAFSIHSMIPLHRMQSKRLLLGQASCLSIFTPRYLVPWRKDSKKVDISAACGCLVQWIGVKSAC